MQTFCVQEDFSNANVQILLQKNLGFFKNYDLSAWKRELTG